MMFDSHYYHTSYTTFIKMAIKASKQNVFVFLFFNNAVNSKKIQVNLLSGCSGPLYLARAKVLSHLPCHSLTFCTHNNSVHLVFTRKLFEVKFTLLTGYSSVVKREAVATPSEGVICLVLFCSIDCK